MNLRYTLFAAFALHALAGLYVWMDYRPVRPILSCVEEVSPGSYVAHLAWNHSEGEPYEIPIGEENRVTGPGFDDIDVGQPVRFLPGRSPTYPKAPFKVRFTQTMTWELGTREVTASRFSPRCDPPEEQKAVPPMELTKVQPAPPPPKKEEPPPPKKEEPPPPKEEPKVEKKTEPAPKKPKIRRKGQPKRKPKPKADTPPPKKAEPVPVTLSNVSLGGGVNVQKGEQDNYGDPSVKATRSNTNQEQGDTTSNGGGSPGGKGTGPAAKPKPPKIVSPQVVSRPKAKWPANAPLTGRIVRVRLSLTVGTDGTVKKVKVIQGAGAVFNAEAIKVAKRIKFKPGTRDGKPISLPVPWTVVFQPTS